MNVMPQNNCKKFVLFSIFFDAVWHLGQETGQLEWPEQTQAQNIVTVQLIEVNIMDELEVRHNN